MKRYCQTLELYDDKELIDQQPGLGLVGGADRKVGRALDKVDLQRLGVAGGKGIAVDLGEQIRGCTLNVEQILALDAHLGHTGQQRPGVGVAGVVVNFVRCADLHDIARVHHRYPVGKVCHHAKVVGDEHNGQVVFLSHLPQQL